MTSDVDVETKSQSESQPGSGADHVPVPKTGFLKKIFGSFPSRTPSQHVSAADKSPAAPEVSCIPIGLNLKRAN